MLRLCTLLACIALVLNDSPSAGANDLTKALTFHAGFDGGPNADFGSGDAGIYTTPDMKPANAKPGLIAGEVELAPGAGKYGDALKFLKKTGSMVFFRGQGNIDYRQEDWSGTVSFWLSLDPDKDLEPGFCDPLLFTDKEWNKACLFVDFTKDDVPRKFRMGVFPDYEVWNPTDVKWDDVPAPDRPFIVIDQPPFASGQWTHVAMTFSGFNRPGLDGTSRLYLNGKLAGERTAKDQVFTWQPANSMIQLGLSYIGLMDDISVFSRELSQEEIASLYGLEGGAGSLHSSP